MSTMTLDKLPQRALREIDLQRAFIYARFVVTAERLQLFRKLHGKELTSVEIGKRVGLHKKYRDLFLDVLTRMGLLRRRGNRYRLSSLGEKYFVKDRSIYWTRLFSAECINYYTAFSVLEEVVKTGKDYRKILGVKHKSDYERLESDPEWAHDFTYMLYHVHQPNARSLAENLDLTGYRNLLDVGGGSGVVSMALVRANPKLNACVFEFELVCRTAKKIIAKERLSKRISTMAGDMYKSLPKGFDVIMFWDIGHIKPSVIKRAYRNLPEGGMIVMGSGTRAGKKGTSLNLLTWQFIDTTPRSSIREEVLDTLRSVGFKHIKHTRLPTGEVLITGRK
ncbi:MAG: methyltransferase [Candidatus Zixiibacteriota bacterium]|nr:MAG: methyltransferase [candidate division Zixibacteria bacterium]